MKFRILIKTHFSRKDNDEKVASTENHFQFQTRLHKTYPISDHNGQNLYPTGISELNASKTISFGAANTRLAYIREYPPPTPSRELFNSCSCFVHLRRFTAAGVMKIHIYFEKQSWPVQFAVFWNLCSSAITHRQVSRTTYPRTLECMGDRCTKTNILYNLLLNRRYCIFVTRVKKNN